MSSEKRLVTFMILTFLSFLGVQYVMDVTGLNPPPPKNRGKAQAKAKLDPKADAPKVADASKPAESAKDKDAAAKKTAEEVAKPGAAAKPPEPEIALAKLSELVIGSAKDQPENGYRLEVQLEQKGAGVAWVLSSRYDADVDGRRQVKRPLSILKYDPKAPPSLALSVFTGERPAAPVDPTEPPVTLAESGEVPLDSVLWEVVRDDKGRAVREVSEVDKTTKAKREGQEITFRTTALNGSATLTKRFRIWKGRDDFELELGFESPQKEQSLSYRLMGPHGIPIEGESYTGTFRDAFFGQVRGTGTEIDTKPAADIAKAGAKRFENTTLPLHFAGVENQYFAAFVEPFPAPKTNDDRWDREAFATVIDVRPDATQKADVSVEIVSKPVTFGPNRTVSQTYRVYTGPKTIEALTPYGAEGLASYRKYQWFGIPGAAWLSMNVIAPLLDRIYALTAQVSRIFGGKTGNYGIAIILLTLLVRMIMFPLGRKQAIAAKKMQDLQPLMKEIQEKYKDDKERQTRETLGLYKKHGVNPIGGCLPALIQLPIFVGLWQALNNSVHLRHASFLYIQNLAAPDMLFKFPTELPFLGQYFNLLPLLVVSLMIVQTKLFAPPATTPEAEMQQKMMKYMMVVMGFMFYKVPSGLGLYFITSSTWQICERLLLPKVTSNVAAGQPGDDKNPPAGGGKGGAGGNGRGPGGNPPPPPKPPGKLAQFWKRVQEEAAKDPTYRNLLDERDKARDSQKDKERGKGNPKARPGRRR